MRTFPILAALFVASAPALVPAAGPPAFAPTTPSAPRVSPTQPSGVHVHALSHTLFAHRRMLGTTHPSYLRNTRFGRHGLLPVIVRFEKPPTNEKLESLRRLGVAFGGNGHPLASGAYQATVNES